jgi:hypothetical protein
MNNIPPFNPDDVQGWAESLSNELTRQQSLMFVDTSTASAKLDGVLVIDPNVPGVYVSWNGDWTQVVAL